MSTPIGLFCICKNFISEKNFKIIPENRGVVLRYNCDLCLTTYDTFFSVRDLISKKEIII